MLFSTVDLGNRTASSAHGAGNGTAECQKKCDSPPMCTAPASVAALEAGLQNEEGISSCDPGAQQESRLSASRSFQWEQQHEKDQ